MGPCPSQHELGPAIDGERRRWKPPGGGPGAMCFYVAARRAGRPLVLVHDLRPCSSAYEMRPLFECFRWRRPTYAPDLPGFGLSERPRLDYAPGFFASSLAELLRGRRRGDLAVDVVALGRGAEIAALVACHEPGLVRSVAMLEPWGLLPARGAGLEACGARLQRLLGDVVARAFFAVLTTRPLLRHALRARFAGAPDPGLVEYAHASGRTPGAHRAPFGAALHATSRAALLALYRALTIPVLVVHDAHAAQTVDLEAFLSGRANRFAVRLSPTRGMPQFERRADTIAALDRFWQTLPRTAIDRAIR